MGYDTSFSGHFDVTPDLTAKQVATLNRFAETEWIKYLIKTEEQGDVGKIVIKDNVVTTKTAKITWEDEE